MPRKSNKRSHKHKMTMKKRIRTQRTKSKKQKPIIMIGCSKKHKIFSSLGNKSCSKCGPNCYCGPNCHCSHNCPGNCYLNRRIKKQKGGSGCGSCGCPLAPLSWKEMSNFSKGQNGGSCAAGCMAMKGGNFFKPPAPIPGPILGSAWNTSVKGLPGENGISGDRNYLNSYASDITNDPQMQISMLDSGYKYIVGGKKRRNKRGGGIIPTELLHSTYNTIKGYHPPVNSLPYKDQLTGILNKNSCF